MRNNFGRQLMTVKHDYGIPDWRPDNTGINPLLITDLHSWLVKKEYSPADTGNNKATGN
jgi:hypothetical protein